MTVNVPESLLAELQALADASGVSRNEYCKRVLESAAKRGIKVQRGITLSHSWVSTDDAEKRKETDAQRTVRESHERAKAKVQKH